MNCAIIIPALNPPESLVNYVTYLSNKNLSPIIVVNDGSSAEAKHIFDALNMTEGCIVLNHGTNKGKGRALKTAFTFVLDHYPQVRGVVTADADGQHAVNDVYRIATELTKNNNRLILGSRNFDEADVPARSRLGNKSTSLLFQWLFGERINDTQTGLRGISIDDLPSLKQLKGERFEYEMNMLIHAAKLERVIEEIETETIYFNNNSHSYYHAVKDSLKIARGLLSGYLLWNPYHQTADRERNPVEDYGK